MKKYFKMLSLCIIFMVCFISWCTIINYFKKSTFKINEYTEHMKGKYYLKTNDKPAITPELTLFDDSSFGFYYDALSFYYPHGNYELKDNKLIAITDDEMYKYIFKYDNGQLVFIQDESSNIFLIDESIGVSIIDCSVFALK